MYTSTLSRTWMLIALAPLVMTACSSDDSDDAPTAEAPSTQTDVENNQPASGSPATPGAMPAGDGANAAEATSDDLPLAPGSAADPGGDASGDTTADGTMTFFVSSAGVGDGGNLGGLDGADGFCTELAVAASPDLARRTWHAYLSTSSVNARERIGAGPWHNQAGALIADGLAALHDQAPAGLLDQTWAPTDLSVPLDEQGNPVDNAVHDILTGTLEDGTLAAGLTCSDWTSSDATIQAQVGHSNRNGGMRAPSWTTTHPVGCGASAENRVQGTVTQGGGRGSIYCFAVITGE
jgi:hypothetical protein